MKEEVEKIVKQLKELSSEMATVRHHLTESDDEDLGKLGRLIEKWEFVVYNAVDILDDSKALKSEVISSIFKDLSNMNKADKRTA